MRSRILLAVVLISTACAHRIIDGDRHGDVIGMTVQCEARNAQGKCTRATCTADARSDCSDWGKRCVQHGHTATGGRSERYVHSTVSARMLC